jgi:cyclopropane fatty-acyl-phospholipid synthase-like methyltransferase
MPTASPGDTATYYDTNTARFMRNQKDGANTIHRALYAPGIRNRLDALLYSHSLVLAELRRVKTERVLDLGCGVGATIRYLLERNPGCAYRGITVSKVQADIAAAQGLPVELWDYHQGDWFDSQTPFDLVYAIESLQHASDLEAVVRNVRRACADKGRFLVIDDFGSDVPVPPGGEKILGRYVEHWHAHGYRRRGDFIRTMEDGGFRLEYSTDLSAYQRSSHLYNLVVYGLLSPLRWLYPVPPYAQNLLGGNALLRLQDLGLSGYHLLVFTRT